MNQPRHAAVPRDHRLDAVRAISEWMRVRAEAGKPVPDDPRAWRTNAVHSLRGGLLCRLMQGKPALDHPPPLFMSRPWYHLIDAGLRGVEGVFPYYDHGGDHVLVGQDRWNVERRLGDGRLVIRNERWPDAFVLTQVPGEGIEEGTLLIRLRPACTLLSELGLAPLGVTP